MNVKQVMKRIIPASFYLKYKFKKEMGRPLNLRNPVYYNDKLQWLKIHDHNTDYIKLVDKLEAKNIVGKLIGEEHIIPTLGVWNSFDEIDFNMLPNQFVLKCTHDSGSAIICRDKELFEMNLAREKLTNSLKQNYYWLFREWPYKFIRPRIIAEEYVEDRETGRLDDYKLFCFDGKVDNIMVVRGRTEGQPKFYHFDREWKLCRFNRLTRSLPDYYHENKPPFIDNMIEIAETLSRGFIHVRIDLYEANGQIYFGEFTLYNQAGMETGFDEYSDRYLGSLIHLPIKKRII